MRCFVGIDDTDSSAGLCTTYLAYRIAQDLGPDVEVLPYPRLVRLNPNIPFKTRGNAAVSLQVQTHDPGSAFETLCSKVRELSDVNRGANSGMVFLDDAGRLPAFEALYFQSLNSVVSPHKVRRMLGEAGAMYLELGNGMGLVGAASSLGFGERFDHTYELIAYRKNENWGRRRGVESRSVREMDSSTFPHTFNNYDYQKNKVLVAPHGPDPVFVGVRGDSPRAVLDAFGKLDYDEVLDGHMVYVTNQHTDAHLQERLDWKVYSSGWLEGVVESVETGPGGHVYITLNAEGRRRLVAAYEPTGDLRREARLLSRGDKIRASGGVRRPSSLHPAVLNMEKFELLSSGGTHGLVRKGVYLSSPRANRHLTKPLVRYGREDYSRPELVQGWLSSASTLRPMLA